MAYVSVNKYAAKCFRCGAMVAVGQGHFTYGHSTYPWPWKEHRYLRNLSLVEHHECHEKYKGTGVHYLFSPDTSMEGFDDNLGLQTDLDP